VKISKDVNSDPIEAISVSAMGDGITPCDQNFSPVSNSILAFDTRNIAEAEEFEQQFGKEWIFKMTGQPVHPTYSITKILWIKKHLPEVFEKAAYYLCFEDFITVLLCGIAASSFSTMSRTMAMNINELCWNDDLLKFASVDSSKFARPAFSGTMLGPIRKEIADELHLSQNVKVVVGGHDQPCGALGCGLFQENVAMDSTGTVEVLLVTTKELYLTKEMLASTICFWPHVLDGEFCACGQILTAGGAFRWFRDEFGKIDSMQAEEQDLTAYDVITSQFRDAPSDVLFVPHLSGSGTPEFNPNAKAAFYGATLHTKKYDIAKSVLEGVSYELKINIDLLENAGIQIDALRALGGAVNSDIWMQMKADITGKSIQACQIKDQCPLGAAILAAFGIGILDDLKQADGFIKRDYEFYEPNEKKRILYDEKFHNYLIFREKIFDLYEEIRN